MGSIAVDNPDCVIDWFPDYPESERARKIIGDCPHACKHRILKIVGWGPSLTHYELLICRDDGCQGNCRQWDGVGTYESRKAIRWKLLSPVA